MIDVEIVNRSGKTVDEAAAVELARSVLAGEGVAAGELGQHRVVRREVCIVVAVGGAIQSRGNAPVTARPLHQQGNQHQD